MLAGLLHLPHDLPICKGPILAAISADEFRPRPAPLLLLPVMGTLHLSQGRVLPSALLDGRVPRDLPPIHQKAGFQPVFGHRHEKDAQTGQGTVEGASGRAREYAWWRLR